MDYQELSANAVEIGYEYGRAAGSWVIGGNTSIDTVIAIAKGYEDGDPQIMDMEPSPLSGEWADDPSIEDILYEIGVDGSTADASDDLLDEFQIAYSDAFWSEVMRVANVHMQPEKG